MRLLVVLALGAVTAGCPANAQSTDDTGECVVCECECECAEPVVHQIAWACDGQDPLVWDAPEGATVISLDFCFTALDGRRHCDSEERQWADGVLEVDQCRDVGEDANPEMVLTWLEITSSM